MLNNSNNFSVETIVAKYVTAIKTQWESTPKYKQMRSPFPSIDLPSGVDFAYAPHQQLLATLWSIVNHNPEEGEIYGELAHFIGFAKRNVLTEAELAFLVSNYKDAVNHIFSLSEDWLWREMSFYEQPENMGDLMTKLLDYKEGETLYIPFVEYGDLAVRFPECKIMGHVTSSRIWAFCCIRLEANGISYDIPYPNQDDSQDIILPESNSVDCLVCDISDGLSTIDGDSLHTMYESLRQGGRMTILVSAHVLGAMDDAYLSFRKRIVREKSLEAVVQLPANIFRTSEDPFFVMCIDKREKEEDYAGTVMADATFASRDYGVKSGLKRFDVERFVEAVQHTDIPENEDICKRIPYDKVGADILLPAHYLVEKPRLAMGLNHVLKMAELNPSITTGVLPAVTLKDLSTTFDKANLAVSDLTPLCDCGKKEDFSVVKKPCVLLCSNGDRVLVGYLPDVPGSGIAISKRVNCFETENADVASAALLLLEDYVALQIKALSVGKLIRKFDDNLLSKIRVLPLLKTDSKSLSIDSFPEDSLSIDNSDDAVDIQVVLDEINKASIQQRDRMQKKLYDTIEHQKQESVIQYEDYRKSVRLRKHALTQSLSSFGSMFKALMNCRKRQNGFLDDADKLTTISDLTVADAFAYLESRLESIQQKLAAIADIEEDFGRPEFIEPIEFINSYIESNKAGWLKFAPLTGWEDFFTNRATKDIPDLEGNGFILRKGDPINTLFFPKKALSKIFDNVIANAVSHGFADSSRGDYKVRFSWKVSGMEMILVIENNGKAISDEVNTANILEYGFSTSLNTNGHNGIGCSEIATIMRDFDGGVEVLSTPEEEYTVKYIFTFKRTNVMLSL